MSRAKLLSSSQTIFLNKLKNIKQSLTDNGFPNNIVDPEIKYFINKTDQHKIDNTIETFTTKTNLKGQITIY